MKKAIYLILLAILTMSLMVSHALAVEKPPIKVGCLQPLTGPVAFAGKFMKEGAMLAIEEINKAGGILGHKVELVLRDTSADPAKAVTFFKELVLKEKCPAIIGPLTSSESLALDPLIKESKIPVFNMDSMDTAINHDANPYHFRFCMITTPMAQAMADFVKKAGFKRVAIAHTSDKFCVGGKDDTLARMKQWNMEPVIVDSYDWGETDLSPHALKMVGAKPDAVICWAYGPPLPTMRRALADLGWKGPFICYSPPGITKDYRALIPSIELIDGTIYSMGLGKFSWPFNRPGMAHVEILIDERLGEMYEHIDAPVAQGDYVRGYMAVMVIKFYIEKAGSPDPEKIKNALETYSFRGPLYDTNFKAGRHELSTDPRECYMATFKDGLRILHEREPKNLPLFEEFRWQAAKETYKRATYKRGVTVREFYRRWQELLKKNEARVRAQIADRKSTVEGFTPEVAKLYEDTLRVLLTSKF